MGNFLQKVGHIFILVLSHFCLPVSAVLAFQGPSTRTLEGHHQIILEDLKMTVRPAVIFGLETITLTERQEAELKMLCVCSLVC